MTHENDNIDIDFQLAPPDKLYAHNRRQLSAMLDGELSPDQARFMLRRLQHDGELAACWERWQVCGDLLRGHGHALLPSDFSQRVAASIAAPATGEATRTAAGAGPRRQHRLLRWGGGALAASMALVALFMARQLPDAQAPEMVEAISPARSAPALVQDAAPVALADAGRAALPPGPGTPTPVPAPAPDNAAALLAAAVPVAVAVAEVPRRTGERNSTRSQSQRAALRRSQSVAEVPQRAVAATAAPRSAGLVPEASVPAVADTGFPLLASLPSAAIDGNALFGALPAATTRPWPRAVLPGLGGTQPLAVRYGMPQADAFAPFQPRLDRHAVRRAHDPAQSRPEPQADSGQESAPEAGSDPAR
ncbi:MULTISPECIES: sigma-E factor negative regulatory protein [unclassified Luteimonas]